MKPLIKNAITSCSSTSFMRIIISIRKLAQEIDLVLNEKRINSKQYLPSIDLPDYQKALDYLKSIRPKPQGTLKRSIDDHKTDRDINSANDISIIVPVYNAETSIEKCINSILNQTVTFPFEIICVDDGSTDSSLGILKAYENRDKRVKVISSINKGASSARNIGIRSSTGEYLLFVDSDDYLPKNALELLMSKARSCRADIVQGSVAKCFNSSGIYSTIVCDVPKDSNFLSIINASKIGTAWGKLYRRELWEKVQFPEGFAFEDAIIWCHIFPQCKSIAFLSEPTYVFRSSKNSLFSKQLGSPECIDALWIIEECINYAGELLYSPEWYQLLHWQLSFEIISRIGLSDQKNKILRAAFVVASHIILKMPLYSKTKFKGKNAALYQKLEHSYTYGSYDEWIDCGRFLGKSGVV